MSVTAWRARERERLARAQRARTSRVASVAGWVFGALILASPFWLLWAATYGGSVLPWVAALAVSFMASEQWTVESAEPEPVLTGFARDAWGLAFAAEVTSRSRERNWQAEVARRERARLLARDRRAAAMREVAVRAAASHRVKYGLPF